MYSATLVFFSLLSSAFAFTVTRPTLTQGWTNQGPQTIAWDRVSTDSTNFTIVLTNINRQLLPSDVVLAPFVDAVAASSISVSPPSGGWPTPGGSYRVNLVKSATELTSIYAQSPEFNITAGAATETRATTAATRATTGTANGAAPTAAGTGAGTAQGAASTGEGSSPSVFADGSNKGSGASSLTFSAGLLTAAGALVGTILL